MDRRAGSMDMDETCKPNGSPTRRVRIEEALEARGVDRALAVAFAEAFVAQRETAPGDSEAAAIDAIALADRVIRERDVRLARASESVDEFDRLLASFACELTKVEEAMQVLTAHVRRMRIQTRFHQGRAVH